MNLGSSLWPRYVGELLIARTERIGELVHRMSSCAQPGPAGGAFTSCESCGGMNPGSGSRRFQCRASVGGSPSVPIATMIPQPGVGAVGVALAGRLVRYPARLRDRLVRAASTSAGIDGLALWVHRLRSNRYVALPAVTATTTDWTASSHLIVGMAHPPTRSCSSGAATSAAPQARHLLASAMNPAYRSPASGQ